MAEQLPEDWRITIDVPLALSDAEREKLLTAIADVVHGWEPEDRDGWDAFVVAGTEDHSAEAHADRLGGELDRLQTRLAAQGNINRSWQEYKLRKKAERERHVDAFEDALGLEHAGRGYWYERMIKAAAEVRAERDTLQARINVVLALHNSSRGNGTDPDGRCYECAELAPCPTRRTLEGKP
jgi:hypothetical protein